MDKTDTLKLSKLPGAIFNALRSKIDGGKSEPHLPEEDGDEVTHRTGMDVAPIVSAKTLDALMGLLEPQLFQNALPNCRGKRVLYVATEDKPYLSPILQREPAEVVCMGPSLSDKPIPKRSTICYHVLSHYGEACFHEDRFDVVILPETTCRGSGFFTRSTYWISLLRSHGECLVALPHPQSRFLLGTREERHRSSRTATFERVFSRVRELGLDVIALRELTLAEIPLALRKRHALESDRLLAYDEVPLVLGLHLKKKDA